MKKKVLFLMMLLMLCGLCIFLFFYYRENKVYVDDYYDVIDFTKDGKELHDYKDVLDVKGKPIEVEIVDEERKKLIYPDYVVAIYERNGNYFAGSIVITNQNIRFGKNEIGVGSTKAEVEMAYFPKKIFKRENSICYYEEWTEVAYFFDDKDVVTKIKISAAEYCW